MVIAAYNTILLLMAYGETSIKNILASYGGAYG